MCVKPTIITAGEHIALSKIHLLDVGDRLKRPIKFLRLEIHNLRFLPDAQQTYDCKSDHQCADRSHSADEKEQPALEFSRAFSFFHRYVEDCKRMDFFSISAAWHLLVVLVER